MLAVKRRSGMMFWLAMALLVTGCSTAQRKKTDPDRTQVTRENSTLVEPTGEKISFRGKTLDNNEFDIPVLMNTAVEYWIDYFTGRGRKHFERYLERSELFIPYIRPILKDNGLPQDLVYQAMIESGFANHARSTAKAVGPWQFIPATGRRYGLMVNWWVDERRDTRKSTIAAGNYLKDLYNWFGSWELAAAAYNAGEAKIARAIQRFGTKNFWALARNRYLRRETRDYVPKIMAAAIVAKNREAFGFPASYAHLREGEAISGDGEVVQVKRSGEDEGSEIEARPKDPAVETLEKVLSSEDPETLDEAPVAQASKVVPQAQVVQTPSVDKKGALTGATLSEFELASPADLLKVAEAAGISYSTVKALNPEILRWVTPPSVGAYRVKLPTAASDKFLETYNHPAFPKTVQFLAVKVKGGETLSKISRHFGLKVDPLVDLNGVGAQAGLRKGSRILLPLPLDRTRSLASLEVRDAPERRRYKRRSSPRVPSVSLKKRENARGARVSLSEGSLGEG